MMTPQGMPKEMEREKQDNNGFGQFPPPFLLYKSGMIGGVIGIKVFREIMIYLFIFE